MGIKGLLDPTRQKLSHMDEVGNTFNTKRFVTMYKPMPKFVPVIQFRVDEKIIPQIGTFRNLNLKSSGSLSVDISKKNIFVKIPLQARGGRHQLRR